MIAYRLGAAVLGLGLLAGPAAAVEIACDGPLGPESTLQAVEQAYGKNNVVTGEVDGAEGMTMIATTVFPNDEDKSFRIYWMNEDEHAGVAGFTVARADTAPGGVKLGMGIREVEALNGQAFGLFGFYWDYGGAASFAEGKLSELPGGCSMALTFSPTVEPPNQKISDAVSGDQELTSDMPELEVVKPVVTVINIGYPDPEGDDFDGEGDGDTTAAD